MGKLACAHAIFLAEDVCSISTHSWVDAGGLDEIFKMRTLEGEAVHGQPCPPKCKTSHTGTKDKTMWLQ